MDGEQKIWKQLKHKSPEIRRKERLNADLLTAVTDSDAPEVQRLLSEQNPPSVNARCVTSKATALHVAVMRGDVHAAGLLLEKGADVNARDGMGRLPLHLAAWKGNLRMFQLILDKNETSINSVVTVDDITLNPQEICSWDHDHSKITSLISSVECNEQSTALHIAALRTHISIVDYLISKEADTSLRDSKGRTPLEVAGLNASRNTDRSQSLFRRAREPQDGVENDELYEGGSALSVTLRSLPFQGSLLRIVNQLVKSDKTGDRAKLTNTSVLHNAIAEDQLSVVEFLLQNDTNLGVLDDIGDTPLHFAVRERKLEALKLIISMLPPNDIDKMNAEGLTALHIAVAEAWEEGVGLLLENGASIRIATKSTGETVFHIAAKLGNPKLMEELLSEQGSEEVVNEKDSQGLAPIHLAIEKESMPLVTLLIEGAEANVNVLLPDGRNLIHFAVLHADQLVLRYLVHLKEINKMINEISPPNPHVAQSGMSPLHIAADVGKDDLVGVLLDAGADPTLKTKDEPIGSTTALHLAAEKGYTRTVVTILNHNVECLDIVDDKQWKALHTACYHGHGNTVFALVSRGANLTNPVRFDGEDKTALELMAIFVPQSGETLNKLFDSYIQTLTKNKNQLLNDPDSSIQLNFGILSKASRANGKRFTFLQALTETDMKDTMLHPLAEIFSRIKWARSWEFFVFLFILYLAHTLSLTLYCILAFIKFSEYYYYAQMMFLASYLIVLITEIRQMRKLRNWNNIEDWIKFIMLITSGAVLVGSVLSKTQWQSYLASFAILASWTELLFLFSWFKYSGLDVLIFEKVSQNVLAVLSKFTFLFFGFAFALMIHFNGIPPFDNFYKSLCQVIAMIVELNYNDAFQKGDTLDIESAIGRLIYICFIVFVGITLTNLTIGISVSDISALQNEGRVERLIKRTSFISFLETIFDDEWIFGFLMKYISRLGNRKFVQFGTVEPIHVVYPNRPGCPVFSVRKIGTDERRVISSKPTYLSSRVRTSLLSSVNVPGSGGPVSTSYFNKRFGEIARDIQQMKEELTALKNETVSSKSEASG